MTAFDTTAVPTSDLMYYRLLQIKVNDKLDSLKYSNEEAEQLVTNFEEKGNEQLLPTAYYYGGRICAENKNAPQALNYFRKAETLLKEHDDNPALLSKVYSQMGYLFVERRMYDEARNCSQKSYELDKSINDTIGMIYNLR
ncbi:MAG: tetratricopeptide repeat protein, partial [Prevotella sp.]|nr:tetratricopeptide repeat protein [Prevotella sp.]